MCGILGLVNFQENLNPILFEESLDKINYRGPDNQGVYKGNHAFLGHNRLSIIDTDHTANQPFIFDDRYYLIFNGEIFNFKSHRKELEDKYQVNFKTHSDTEVLLHLLIHKGTSCLKSLNGFFAFAFYDKTEQKLLLARDRFGIKPLYFSVNNQTLAFSSELSALFKEENDKDIELSSLYNYLRFNFMPATSCILKNVYQLQPGCLLQYSNEGIKKKKYYEIPKNKPNKKLSSSGLQSELKKILKSAVRRQMISDVPIGCFLSGGLDSSIVCALSAQETRKLKTFSIGFKKDKFYDESKYADLVAKKYKTDHRCIYVTEEEMLEEVHFLLNNLSEPFADSSSIAMSILCKHTSKEVKVALSGDGADELFGGYNRYVAAQMMEKRTSYYYIIKGLYPFIKNYKADENNLFGNRIRQAQKFGRLAQYDFKERYIALCENLNKDSALKIINSNINTSNIPDITPLLNREMGIHSYLLNDMQFILPGDMLYKVDRTSMLHSLEVRPVFLDNQLAEFAMQLPLKYKIKGHTGKAILKETFKDLLPKEILTRHKHGFEVPLSNWFCGPLKSTLDNYTSKEFIMSQNIFIFAEINIIKQTFYKTKRKDIAATLWAILVFNKWWEREIKK